MPTRRVLFTALTLALLSAPAFAQDTKPSTTPAPGASAPMTAPRPSTTGATIAPVGAKINLNTATAAELDKLPKLGPTHSKAIMEARGKAKFKSWDDFVARKVVPVDSAAAIKDVVTF
jgi:DNA uptake protein ComE-like DNA-binding protein